MRGSAVFIVLLLSAAGAAAQGNTFDGRVKTVVDGDTLWVMPSNAKDALPVRLKDIDAPESCQDYGDDAKRALADLVAGKPVLVRGKARDSHGRLVADLYIEGLHVNPFLVAEGHAWSARFKWDQGPYVKQERQAKALKRGLHALGGAQMPRDFRRTKGPCAPASGAAR